jgi:hypothetical protein
VVRGSRSGSVALRHMSDEETQGSGDQLDDARSPSTESEEQVASPRASGLFRRSGAPRPPRPSLPPREVKALVDGLDTTERNLGIAAVVLAIVLDFVNFYANRHSPIKTTRSGANFELISNLIFAGILGLGLGLRRRALLGFGAFFFGLEQAFTEKNVSLGLPFLVFGGWLIVRASQKQQQSRAAGGAKSKATSRPTAKAKTGSTAGAGRPKASKRYTPPQRSRGGGAR